MTVCPLCEHVQEQGDECDNCGKPLAAPTPAREVKVPQLRGLEQGREASAPPAPLPAPPVAEAAEDERIRCPNCGVRSLIAPRCPACGVPTAVPT